MLMLPWQKTQGALCRRVDAERNVVQLPLGTAWDAGVVRRPYVANRKWDPKRCRFRLFLGKKLPQCEPA